MCILGESHTIFPSPVRHYMVSVTTGQEKDAETDSPVYITAHGEFGDWGKRYLIHSNNNKKFRTGQVGLHLGS